MNFEFEKTVINRKKGCVGEYLCMYKLIVVRLYQNVEKYNIKFKFAWCTVVKQSPFYCILMKQHRPP